jgi:hypothetical protein
LTRLQCQQTEITSLEPLKGLVNLINLKCSNSQINGNEIKIFKKQNTRCNIS